MPFVLDGSVAVSWFFDDEVTPAAAALRDSLADDQALVPGHWSLEVANALIVGLRRRRISAKDLNEAFALLLLLPIECDTETHEQAWSATTELARRHRLSSYDAAYLELATRTALPLATLDAALAKAARAERVQVIGPLGVRR